MGEASVLPVQHFASSKERKPVTAPLKQVYRAKDAETARQKLDEFDAGPRPRTQDSRQSRARATLPFAKRQGTAPRKRQDAFPPRAKLCPNPFRCLTIKVAARIGPKRSTRRALPKTVIPGLVLGTHGASGSDARDCRWMGRQDRPGDDGENECFRSPRCSPANALLLPPNRSIFRAVSFPPN